MAWLEFFAAPFVCADHHVRTERPIESGSFIGLGRGGAIKKVSAHSPPGTTKIIGINDVETRAELSTARGGNRSGRAATGRIGRRIGG